MDNEVELSSIGIMSDQDSLMTRDVIMATSQQQAQHAPPESSSAPDDAHVHFVDTDDNSTEGLLSRRKMRLSFVRPQREDWMRPYWLGCGLFLILFSFWLLDSLKDPVFASLVNGNLDRHQPPAKLCSVGSTLALVCLLEFLSNAQKQRREQERSEDHVMDPGGHWTRMGMDRPHQASNGDDGDRVIPVSTFTYIGGAYVCVFSLLAYVLRNHPGVVDSTNSSSSAPWHVLGYILYSTVESFGSLSVATFWSYTNSTLSLDDAESFYGMIVAIAQLGAIGGSSMVTTNKWSTTSLILVANLVIILQILVMKSYARRFPPTAIHEAHTEPSQTSATKQAPMLLSGIYLILRHNYVLLILGVSCLYEVSLTCLDYQLKLLGWYKFEQSPISPNMSFTQFMGRYGQLTNITSLLLSYFAFPVLIHKFGLRVTVLMFPTLLLFVTFVAYGALPGNLAVLFVSMAILKAMTYSIHDPSKELLYSPTSNAIKFRAKFWIDVVGARVAKAIGSSINTYAGSVDRSVQVGSVPSLLTAAALWFVCFRAGVQFNRLVRSGSVVGHDSICDYSYEEGYLKVSTQGDCGDLEADQDPAKGDEIGNQD